MAFEPGRVCKLLALMMLASCASGRSIPPAPKPEVVCHHTVPNLIHVLKMVGAKQSKMDAYEFCVSREGALHFVRGSEPAHRGQITDEQMQALKQLLARASQRLSREISYSCSHPRSLLVEWAWSGRYFAAHEACDETQPVLATEVHDSAWRILRLESVKARPTQRSAEVVPEKGLEPLSP